MLPDDPNENDLEKSNRFIANRQVNIEFTNQ